MGMRLAKFVLVYGLLHIQLLLFAQDLSQQTVPGRVNAPTQLEKPYVIYISADGFRPDYVEKYQAKNLIALREKGVYATSMQPSFPTVTFSNHYTLATGMYPAHHGIVNNSFYDPNKQQIYAKSNRNSITDSTWYKGLPIWVLAEQQQLLSAAFYWVGSETAIMGVRPTYWYNFNTQISMETRIEAVKNWLALPAAVRPHLINFYFPEVDVASHYFGAESSQTAMAVQLIDHYVGQIIKLAEQSGLPVNFVFVSDHGMANVDNINTLPLPPIIDKEKFIVPAGDALLQIYAKDKSDILPLYKGLKEQALDYDVYLSDEMPKRLHFSAEDNSDGRIGDLILIPHYPKVFNLTGKPTTVGKHGFDNEMPAMQAVFYAWGPAFKSGIKINAFENVHVYPLIAKILGLTYSHKIDGNIEVLQDILK